MRSRFRLVLLSIIAVLVPAAAWPELPGEWWGGFEAQGLAGRVLALVEYQGDVVAGGRFVEAADDTQLDLVGRWDGSRWHAFDQGLDTPRCPDWPICGWRVEALAVQGDTLYAGGWFPGAMGVPSPNVVMWDGSAWRAMGAGLNNTVRALTLVDRTLYAAGTFTQSGDVMIARVARWDGDSWKPVGSGLDGNAVTATEFEGDLVVTGAFRHAGGIVVEDIAVWDGTSWSAFVPGFPRGGPGNMIVRDGKLVVGWLLQAGELEVRGIAAWDGSAWEILAPVPGNSNIFAMTYFGSYLVVGGTFETIGSNIAAWNGSAWGTFGAGVNDDVFSLLPHRGSLYVGGAFSEAGGKTSWLIGRWDPATPVTLADFHALSDGVGVRVTWRLAPNDAASLRAVHVQRAAFSTGPFATLESLVPSRETVAFVDHDAKIDRTWWYRLVLESHDGSVVASQAVSIFHRFTFEAALLPPVLLDDGSYRIRYRLTSHNHHPRLLVYDVRGRLVTSLGSMAGEPGEHVLIWDPQARSPRVARGIYFLTLLAPNASGVQRFVVTEPW